MILSVFSPRLFSFSVSVSAGSSGVFKLGGEGTLQCLVTGLSPGTEVTWERPDGSKRGSSTTVQLNPVASSDAGTWKCSFSHGGETYHESLEIKVKGRTLASKSLCMVFATINAPSVDTATGKMCSVFAFRPNYNNCPCAPPQRTPNPKEHW